MAAPTNPRIEELKARVRVDPKSRHFYPLAEELRRAGRFEEAEQVLRDGLTAHPTYLSAWIVLGRVLKETGKLDASRDALAHALTLDQGNVVAARLAADVYMLLGEKVEAIKKYKLVHALMPGDQEVEAIIAGLERELQPPAPASVGLAAPEEEPVPTEEVVAAPAIDVEAPDTRPVPDEAVGEPETVVEEAASASAPFDMSYEPGEAQLRADRPAGDAAFPAAGSVFEEEPAMNAAGELPAGGADEWPEEEAETAEAGAPAEVIATVTMGDLYLSQGHPEAAGEIYRKVLEREPSNDAAREKLAQLNEEETPEDPRQRKIAALRIWLQKVSAQ